MAFTKKEQRTYWRKDREKALDILGRNCFICGNNTNVLVFHKKDGKKHPNTNVARLALAEPGKFVVLCRHQCHMSIHWCMKFLNLQWEDIVKLATG